MPMAGFHELAVIWSWKSQICHSYLSYCKF